MTGAHVRYIVDRNNRMISIPDYIKSKADGKPAGVTGYFVLPANVYIPLTTKTLFMDEKTFKNKYMEAGIKEGVIIAVDKFSEAHLGKCVMPFFDENPPGELSYNITGKFVPGKDYCIAETEGWIQVIWRHAGTGVTIAVNSLETYKAYEENGYDAIWIR